MFRKPEEDGKDEDESKADLSSASATVGDKSISRNTLFQEPKLAFAEFWEGLGADQELEKHAQHKCREQESRQHQLVVESKLSFLPNHIRISRHLVCLCMRTLEPVVSNTL